MSKSAALYGTGIVLAHLLVNIAHGAAHVELHIDLDFSDKLFIGTVIFLCPLLAMLLLWTKQLKVGLTFLGISMTAGLLFGLEKHLVAMGPDHIGRQGQGMWAMLFAVTVWLLVLTQVAAILIALYFLFREPDSSLG